jgi:hypothetical protein
MTDQDRRQALDGVAEALRPLHKSLLDVVRVEYERANGRVAGAGALFDLVTRDPFFAWLRPMSGLMAHIDELLDEKEPLPPGQLTSLRGRVEALVTEGDHPFAARYLQILQSEPAVVMAHAQLRRALDRL